jgi:hypothetical protein
MAIEWHSKLANLTCKIYGEKPYIAFLKVVEDMRTRSVPVVDVLPLLSDE